MRFVGFRSRDEAGKRLAERLANYKFVKPVILALPRGGVPVGLEIARALKAPLDVLLVRKIGVPWQKELAAAAVVDGEKRDLVYNDEVMAAVGLTKELIEKAAAAELTEIDRRRALYLKGRVPVPIEGRTAVVVDDGIATGTTVKAALHALRRRKPLKLVLAIPVAPAETIAELRPLADEVICLEQPAPFFAIGEFYSDFHQVSDDEVIEMLRTAKGLET